MCGVGTRDPCTRIISVLTCIGFFLFVLHVVCCEFWAAAIFQQEVLAWEDVTWQRSRCTVLSAGVSCIEANHGRRGGRKLCSNGTTSSNATTMDTTNSIVFPLQRAAICPGTYFCAEEHQPCICNGEISYGPVLFDGYRYQGPVNNSVYSNASAGHLCGVDQHGQQLPDPAPKQRKFCWCTPRRLQRFTTAAGYVAPGCVDAADRRSFAKSATVESEVVMKRYTPWALVREEQSSSIACAYEFGIPRPSTDLMEQKAQQAQLLVHHWATDPRRRPCWIRRPREDGRSPPCSIALEPPGMLEGRAEDMKRLATEHLMLCAAFVASLLCLCCWIFSASAREVGSSEQPLLVST